MLKITNLDTGETLKTDRIGLCNLLAKGHTFLIDACPGTIRISVQGWECEGCYMDGFARRCVEVAKWAKETGKCASCRFKQLNDMMYWDYEADEMRMC